MARGAATATLSVLLLACGGGTSDEPTETVSSRPLAVPLRPGETELVQYQRDQPDTVLTAPFDDIRSARWLDIGFAGPCAVPHPDCRATFLTADDTDGDRPAERLAWPFTHDPLSRLTSNHSYAPVNPFPSTPGAAAPAIRMAAGGGITVAVDADGLPWVWGDNGAGLTGRRDPAYRSQPARARFDTDLPPLRAIDASTPLRDDGQAYVVAVDTSRQVWIWGAVADLTDDADAAQPVQVPFDRPNVIAVAAGARHALALRDDGTVWAWGHNGDGRLGTGQTGTGVASVPQQVLGLTRITAIAAGADHSLALDADGAVWGWGNNHDGQAGGDGQVGGDARRLNSPHRVADLGAAVAIDAGTGFSLAVRRDGTVWAWGRTEFGQTGAPATDACGGGTEPLDCSRTPQRVTGLDRVDSIAAGGNFGLARQRDGTVWAWGDNTYGQLGGLPGLGSIAPVQVQGLGPVQNIAAGARHALAAPVAESCAVGEGRVGARLMAWGDNLVGERGDGTALNAPRPTPVLTLGDDNRCAATIGHRLLVMLSGTAAGTLTSDAPGLACTVAACWQAVPDGTRVRLTATPADGAELGDWRWDCAAAGTASQATVEMTGVRHCKLRFMVAGSATARALSLTIVGDGRVTSSPAGIDCSADCEARFPLGTVLALTASPAEGATFWDFIGFACLDGMVTLDRDVSCTARFTSAPPPPEATLTLTVAAGGHVTSVPAGLDCAAGATCAQTFATGTTVQLTATPEAGFRFDRFSGDESCGASMVLTADLTCNAEFAPLNVVDGLVLSVVRTGPAAASGQVQAVSPAGAIDCGAVCDAIYPAGTVVALRAAVTGEGTFFSHWTGCNDTGTNDDGDLLCYVLMNASQTVEADFE
jgi:hypothetical protein